MPLSGGAKLKYFMNTISPQPDDRSLSNFQNIFVVLIAQAEEVLVRQGSNASVWWSKIENYIFFKILKNQ